MVAGVAMAHFIAMEARWTAFFGTIDTLGRLAAGAAGVGFEWGFDKRRGFPVPIDAVGPAFQGVKNGDGHALRNSGFIRRVLQHAIPIRRFSSFRRVIPVVLHKQVFLRVVVPLGGV